MKNLQANKVEFLNYKLTISRSSARKSNFKHEVIEATPIFSENVDELGLDNESFLKIDEWSRNFWSHTNKDGEKNSTKYESELRRAIYDVTEEIFIKWKNDYVNGIKKELKKIKKLK